MTFNPRARIVQSSALQIAVAALWVIVLVGNPTAIDASMPPALRPLSGGIDSLSPLHAAALVPVHGALWGAWVAPVGGQTDAQAVSVLESKVGRHLDVIHQYHAFDENWPTATEYNWAAGGRVIFANVSARQRSGSVLTWTAISNGSQDSTINALASRLKAFGHRVFLSFDEEPENRYHSNQATYTLASFAAAYRHIHSLFVADHVTNVVWVWNVTGFSGDESLYGQLYPGDSYVDWVGWDPYNWFNCPVNSTSWHSFDSIVAPFYNWVSAGHLSSGSATKPFMLAEYGTVENTTTPTKGQWFTSAVKDLPNRPKIKAVVYFDENKDCNWPVTTSAGSLNGFASAGKNCYVNRAIPSAPGGVTASPRNAAAVVSWKRAGSVCSVTAYTVTASPGGKRLKVGGAVLSTTFGGLVNGTAYTFRLTATSVNGTSAPSATSPAVTPMGPSATASPSPSPGPSTTATPTTSTTPRQTASPSVWDGAVGVARWLAAGQSRIALVVFALLVLLAGGLGYRYLSTRSRQKR